jgi:hypothetical protein
MFQMAVVYVLQKAKEYDQPFAFRGPPKFTQIGIFGSKKHHLATLPRGSL